MKDPAWYGIGRFYAFLNATCFLLGSAIFLLVSFNLTTPPRPSFAADPTTSTQLAADFFAYQRAVWPQVYASLLLLLVGFLSLIPLGLALRELFGHSGARQELMWAGVTSAALLGAASMLLDIGRRETALRLSTAVPPEALISLGVSQQVWVGPINWLLSGFLLLGGFGFYLASRLALQQGKLPRGWALLGIVVAILYWLGIVAQLSGVFLLFQLVVLVVGVILGPIWAYWLARELGRIRETAPVGG